MTVPNGRANGSAIDNPSEQVAQTVVPPAVMNPSTGPQLLIDQVKELVAELEVPFDPALIEWRVTNTTKSGKLRGQVIPYADPRPTQIASIPCSLPRVGHGSMPSIPARTSNAV